MQSDHCEHLHQVHYETATRQSYAFVSALRHVSVSIRENDATWIGIMKLLCAEADDKRSIHVTFGVRNARVERAFSTGPHFPTIARHVALHPEIDTIELAERLREFYQQLDKLLVDIDSDEALIKAVEQQGASLLILGSWTHSRPFWGGRSAEELRNVLSVP